LSVNTHAARDLGRHASSLETRIASGSAVAIRPSDVQMERMAERDVIAAMRRIKAMLGARPIIWVGHINVGPPGRAGEQPYPIEKSGFPIPSKKLPTSLATCFFDQTECVRELGQASRAGRQRRGSVSPDKGRDRLPGRALLDAVQRGFGSVANGRLFILHIRQSSRRPGGGRLTL
jgi:hypothetical protein